MVTTDSKKLLEGYLVEVVHIDEPQNRAYKLYGKDWLTVVVGENRGKPIYKTLRGKKLFNYMDLHHQLLDENGKE